MRLTSFLRRARAFVAPASILATLGVTATALALGTGARAPEIGLRDLDGHRVTVASLRGKVVLVDFWASWCEPCSEEMPVLEQLYQRYRRMGFSVVAVSQDRQESNVRSFLGQHHVSFPILHDASHQVAGRYQPQRMPSSFIIDRRGVVRHVHAGYHAGDGERMEREIRALLEQH